MTNEHARQQLRESLKKNRQQLENRAQLERQVMTRLLEHPYLQEPRLIASYQSLPDELNTWQLNESLLKSGHTLSLPVMLPGHKGKMNFYKVSSLADLKVNSYGISEPIALEELKVRPDYIELIIVPLVGFDLKGNRLGMGGGYYDRMLKKVSVSCLSIALAFDEQQAESIPRESWDMPVDEVITPTRRLIFCAKE